MPKTIEEVLERVRSWPKDRQEDAAHVLDEIERAVDVYQLSDDERRLVQVGLDQAERGEFVPDAEMEACWNRNKRQ